MKKSERRMLLCFLVPIVVFFAIIYVVPTYRTVYMSFFKVPGIAAPQSTWEFVGLKNFVDVLKSPLFRVSYKNMLFIMLFGGIANFVVAMFFASVLNKKFRTHKILKAIIYLPNIITPVAMVVMWTQFAFNNRYGLLKTLFESLGLQKLAEIPWTSQEWSFWAMLIAYTFGGIGYYMVMFMAAMDRVPTDLYSCADLEGATGFQKYFRITLPLIKDITKTGVVLWCLNGINFFLWSRVFSVTQGDPATITPANYMYNLTFGTTQNAGISSATQVGQGAVVGVFLCLNTIFIYLFFNWAFGKEQYEY